MNWHRFDRRTIFLAFALACMPYGYASDPYTPTIINPLLEPWRWKHFPELEGKGIRDIVEAPDNKVWASCNEGVLEYDGYHWKTHDTRSGLPTSPMEQLLASDEGVMYATSTRGIFRYDGRRWTHFFQAPENFPFTFLNIRQLSDGSIIACADRGIIHFDRQARPGFYSSPAKIQVLQAHFPQIEWIALPEAALNEAGDLLNTSDALETGDGFIWFALTTQMESGKLLRFPMSDLKHRRVTTYKVFEGTAQFPLGEGQKLLLAADKKLWVVNSSSNKGVHVFDGQTWEHLQPGRQFGRDEYMTDIVQSANGAIWIASMASIFTYASGKWQMYKAPEFPIPANRVMLQNSRDDKLWVAGYKSKVLLIDFSPEQWATYARLNFQCEVSPGEQWFLEADNRVVHRKGNDWQAYDTQDGLIDAPIRVIATSKGQIWAAGSHKGVAATALLKNGVWERHLHPRLSWGIDYRSVFEARDGALWFGGAVDAEQKDGFLSGLLHLPDPTAAQLEWIHHVYGENGLKQANVYGIAQSPDGRIWIGGSKLYYYDGSTWKYLPDERLQQYVNVVYSTEDRLIVGSRFYGVFIFDGENWENHTTASGLSGNTIISIDVLPDSSIIVATENDICKYDGRSWTRHIFPEKLNMDFEGGTLLHTVGGAIWINHAPRSWKRRAYPYDRKPPQNEHFSTYRYQPNSIPPETAFDFFLETVSPKGNSLISWKGIDFFGQTVSGKLSFSYRLDGGEWSVFSQQSQHTFTSLPGGKHTLEVRARDLDFNVDPTPARIEFNVLLPLWQQGWFILLILAFLVTFGIFEYRLIRKKRTLETLNVSLKEANRKLKEKSRKIAVQNEEILAQKDRILEQARILEINNKDLESRNTQIRQQRDKLEDMVAQVEKLSMAKLAFFTNISHELRTPLTLILGPIAQLQKEGKNLSAAERKQLQDIIQRNAARLLKLINQLLEIRRIEHGSLDLTMNDIYLPDYLAEILSLFENMARRQQVVLDFYDRSEKERIALDADKVEKVISNLLSNAFKHTPARGSIRVGLDTVHACDKNLDTAYEKYVEITVSDSGCGISSEKIDHIFERYYTSASNLLHTADSGIGLSYTRDLIHVMQGQIRVESQADKGTTFRVYLPFVPVRESQLALPAGKATLESARQEALLLQHSYVSQNLPVQERPMHPGQPRLLLVEDNPDMLHLLESVLGQKYNILKAENGREGLQAAQNHTVDLILSDVTMPEMDGLTFCEKIKTSLATSHIPIILLTAKILDQHKMAGYLKGADDYIAKPFNPELLEIRIENLLQQRRQLREVFNKEFMLTPHPEKLTSPDEIFLQKLVDIMHENLAEPDFNVNKMCEMVYLSHMHFIRKVKQLTGKKPVDLLKSFRMKKAKDLLTQKKLTVAEVAYKVGFDLPNSFSRAFKKEFDLSPTEFVNQLPATPPVEMAEEML